MDEYISRHEAIRAVQLSYGNYEATRKAIFELPAADGAPVRHGTWITWEEAANFIPSPHRHECSVCHDAAQMLANGFELLSDYCPNCGARMDGAE